MERCAVCQRLKHDVAWSLITLSYLCLPCYSIVAARAGLAPVGHSADGTP